MKNPAIIKSIPTRFAGTASYRCTPHKLLISCYIQTWKQGGGFDGDTMLRELGISCETARSKDGVLSQLKRDLYNVKHVPHGRYFMNYYSPKKPINLRKEPYFRLPQQILYLDLTVNERAILIIVFMLRNTFGYDIRCVKETLHQTAKRCLGLSIDTIDRAILKFVEIGYIQKTKVSPTKNEYRLLEHDHFKPFWEKLPTERKPEDGTRNKTEPISHCEVEAADCVQS